MPRFLATSDVSFPPPSHIDEHGIIAVGGELTVSRLLSAYSAGIFPWPHEGFPLLWFCPDPRYVLEPKNVVINQSLKKAMQKTKLEIKADFDFLSVITKCKEANRVHQEGTWITDEMVAAYRKLFELGFAHSIEAYDQGVLVGGLYGVSLGAVFFGESMFFEQSNASKISFVTLVAHLLEWEFSLIDCQAHTSHLERFGAHAIPRKEFLRIITHNQSRATKMGPWTFHLSPRDAVSRLKSGKFRAAS